MPILIASYFLQGWTGQKTVASWLLPCPSIEPLHPSLQSSYHAHNCAILCNTVRYCTILFNTVQYCVILYNTVQYCLSLMSFPFHCLALHGSILTLHGGLYNCMLPCMCNCMRSSPLPLNQWKKQPRAGGGTRAFNRTQEGTGLVIIRHSVLSWPGFSTRRLSQA